MTENAITAEQQITDSLDRAQKCLDKIFDPKKDKVDHAAILSLVSHFTTVVLLETLRRKDPAEADRITAWLEDINEAGDTTGELVYQWRDQIARGHRLTGIGPTADEPAPPAEAYPFMLRHREDGPPMEVLAVPGHVLGLVATQALTGGGELGEYKAAPGQWNITHTASGHIIAGASYPLDTAQQIIDGLGATGLNWTRSVESLTKDDDGVRIHAAAVTDAFTPFDGCRYCTDADHLPVAPWRTPAAPAAAGSEVAS